MRKLLDFRHCIAKEGTGDLHRTWVFRFCGRWIGSFRTKREALAYAREWETARQRSF